MDKEFATFDEARDYAEAMIAEDDVECEIAYVNDGSLAGGHWLVEVRNADL